MKRGLLQILLLLIMFTLSGCFGNVEEKSICGKGVGVKLEKRGDGVKVISEGKAEALVVEIEGKIVQDKIKVDDTSLLIVQNIENKTIVNVTSKSGERESISFMVCDVENEINAVLVKSINGKEADTLAATVKRANDEATLLGDFNQDSEVGIFDFIFFTRAYGTKNDTYDIGPADKGNGVWANLFCKRKPDGNVDISDFIVFAYNYGKSKPSDSVKDKTAPYITITSAGISTIEMKWEKVTTASTYAIYRSNDDVTYNVIATTSAVTFKDIGLTPFTKYFYKITYLEGGQESLAGDVTEVFTTNGGNVSIPDTTKVLSLKDANIMEVSGTAVIFSGTTGRISNIKEGDIIACGITTSTPLGLLKRVLSVTKTGTNTIINTEDAVLQDAISDADITIQREGLTSTFVPSENVSDTGNAVSGSPKRYSESRAIAVKLEHGVEVNGTVSYEVDCDFKLNIKERRLKELSVMLNSSVKVSFELTGPIGEFKAIEKSIYMGAIKSRPKIVMVGDIPVVLQTAVGMDIDVNLTATHNYLKKIITLEGEVKGSAGISHIDGVTKPVYTPGFEGKGYNCTATIPIIQTIWKDPYVLFRNPDLTISAYTGVSLFPGIAIYGIEFFNKSANIKNGFEFTLNSIQDPFYSLKLKNQIILSFDIGAVKKICNIPFLEEMSYTITKEYKILEGSKPVISGKAGAGKVTINLPQKKKSNVIKRDTTNIQENELIEPSQYAVFMKQSSKGDDAYTLAKTVSSEETACDVEGLNEEEYNFIVMPIINYNKIDYVGGLSKPITLKPYGGINIKDPNLLAVLKSTLSITDGAISKEAVEGINELNASNKGITTLEGLETITSIKSWDLSKNLLTNVDGLKGLKDIDGYLNLDENGITNIDGLSNLTGGNATIKFTGIDNFIPYIDGSIRLKGNKLTNVNGLKGVQYIDGTLDLSNNQLNDITGLSNLIRIESLHLYSNKLSSLNGLEKLIKIDMSLDASNNQLTNLDNLTSLKALNELYMTNNQLTNIDMLSKLTEIDYVWLGKNKLTNIDGLKGITSNISMIKLNDNELTNVDSLKNVKESYSIDLSNNKLTNINGLANLTSVKETLDISNNKLTDVNGLAQLTKVYRLRLNQNQITNIDGLSKLNCEIRVLDLSKNQISNLNSLKNLTKIYYLLANYNQITNIDGLINLENNEDIELNDNKITNVDSLRKLSKITILKLNNNQLNNIDGLINLKEIYEIDLTNNQLVNLYGLSNVTTIHDSLFLSNNKLTNVDGLKNITTFNSSIYLDNNQLTNIDGLEGLTSAVLIYLNNNNLTAIDGLNKFTKLTYIDLSNNRLVSVNGLNGSENLSDIYLNNNQLTTVNGFNGVKTIHRINLKDNQLTQIGGFNSVTQLYDLLYNGKSLSIIDGFKSLETITKDLDLSNNQLYSIDGFKKLKTVEGSLFLNNNKLTNLDGLQSLESVYTLNINQNQLTDTSGLGNLTSVAFLTINENKTLTALINLNKLITIDTLYLENNNLVNIDGLKNLTSAKVIELDGNKLSNLNGLQGLKSVSERLSLTNNKLFPYILYNYYDSKNILYDTKKVYTNEARETKKIITNIASPLKYDDFIDEPYRFGSNDWVSSTVTVKN